MLGDMRLTGTPKQLEARRHKAIVLLRKGETYRSVAEKVNASLSSVVRWHQAYSKDGRKGLRARSTPGRPPWLGASQKQRLAALLLKGPLASGYSTDVWTLRRIGRLIEKRFGRRYSGAGVWKLMRQELGWSCQKPERRALQRNEKDIELWKRVRWPRIKKSRSGWCPSGIPR